MTEQGITRRPGFLGEPSRLELDEATGFLQSPRHDGITALTKVNILDIYRQSGNLTAASRINGVEPRLVRWHMTHDPAFKAAIDEARQEIADNAEGFIVKWMGEPKNVIDRLAWLRAHRPERWNPKAEVSITHQVDVTARLAEKARHALNTTAETITTPERAQLDSPDKAEGQGTEGLQR